MCVRTVSLLEVSPTGPSIDAIFQAFDDRDCDINGCTCHVNVHGVHDDGRSKWVQLMVKGAEQTLITLRLFEGPAGFVARIA